MSTTTPTIAPLPASTVHSMNTAAVNVQPEIKLPAENKPYTPPSFWPLATGWWLVIALLTILLGIASYKGYRYRQMKKQQNTILKILETLEKALQHKQSSTTITQLNQLLRRLALMHFPRQQVASLTGEQWLIFLDKTGNTTVFTQGAGRILAEGPYVAQLPQPIDHHALIKAVKQWLTHIHHQYHGKKGEKQWR